MSGSPSASYSSVSGTASGTASASLAAGAEATAELLAAIDAGTLTKGAADGYEDRHASLRQGLAYAMSGGRVGAILTLAYDCNIRLRDRDPLASPREVLASASKGDWATVAYQAAMAADAEDDEIDDLVEAKDLEACKALRVATGEVRAQLPRDLRLKFAKTGKVPPVLHVEQHRWLLPRPRKDQLFLARDGSRLPDGWYCVVHYPLADDLREAVLRRKHFDGERRDIVARHLRGAGETLVCKAAKAGQWELVTFLMEKAGDPEVQIAAQLRDEFSVVWGEVERTACLQSHHDLETLCAALRNDVLSRPWRLGALEVPQGARRRAPKVETLKDALALGPLSMQALRLVGGASLVFSLPQSAEATREWRADLRAAGEASHALPLLHRVAREGQGGLVARLLTAMVDAEARDARGLTALAAAAEGASLEVVEALLDGGCRADGASGALAVAAAERYSRQGVECRGEEAEQWAALAERLKERRRRPPAASLEEYFRRQAAGEIVHGTEPRRYEAKDGELRVRGGGVRVATRVFALDGVDAVDSSVLEVCFAVLDQAGYTAAVDTGFLDLSRRRLVSERQVAKVPMAVPVVVPRGRLRPSGDELKLEAAGGSGASTPTGPWAAALPAIARAPPLGGLRVESVTRCCQASIGKVAVVVDGVRVGETQPPGLTETVAEELQLLVPARELEVTAEMSGRLVTTERIVGSPDAKICVEVGLAVYAYVQPVDEDGKLDFVFVCGHRRDMPEDARPFIGRIAWDSGSADVSSHEPAVMEAMGEMSCLTCLSSMRLTPDLPPGKRFEMVAWEDTSTEDHKACQYQRCLINPVRVGKIESME